jgi:hypothetical protein
MSHKPGFDTSIPVLTEVVQETPAARPGESAHAEAAPASARPTEAQLEARAAERFGEREWNALERHLCERILHQLQGRVDFVLEQRLRDSMADVLQHALSGLTSEVRVGLQQTIEQIVVRAVAQEVAHLKTLRD